MLKDYTWGPVSAKSAGVNRHFRRCHPSSIYISIHFTCVHWHWGMMKINIKSSLWNPLTIGIAGAWRRRGQKNFWNSPP